MPVLRSIRAVLLLGTSVGLASPAFAQIPAPSQAAPAPNKRIYAAADFARFAPKTAYDMLVQVPSFTIRTADTTERGLGQA